MGVLDNSQSTSGDRLVLLALAESADIDSGECFPSIATIARRANLSKRATQYALRKLESMGEITTIPGESRYSTNIYRINKNLLNSGVQYLHPLEESRGASSDTPGVQPTAPKPLVKPSVDKKNSTSSKKTEMFSLPMDWEPSERMTAYADEQGVRDIPGTIADFVEHFANKNPDEKRANWDLSWQRWCRNQKNFTKPSNGYNKPTRTVPEYTNVEPY